MSKPRRGIAVSCGRVFRKPVVGLAVSCGGVFLEYVGLGLTNAQMFRRVQWWKLQRGLTGPFTFREIRG